ncbi:MAG: hypothetical protein K5886_09750 [Lachnospiraceae bacterium]|nr:hypothetical protein [Lachnospiraceae bacterium]
MDKYEYQLCADRIKALIAEKRFAEAMDIADTIDWRRVKSVSMLGTVSEIYKINRRYEESRDILLLAYERYPSSRTIVYALCELSVKMDDIVQAISFYREFVKIAPGDTGSYILLYKIYTAQEVSLEERIEVLEEYKKREYKEKWAYELAYLYHLTGQETKCIEACDELILWFGTGKYVNKAMELKKLHASLSATQELKYQEARNRAEAAPREPAPSPVPANAPAPIPSASPNLDLVPEYEQMYTPAGGDILPASDIRIREEAGDKQGSSQDKFSTKNLQSELQESMEAYLSEERDGEADDHILESNLGPQIEPVPVMDANEGEIRDQAGMRAEEVPDENVAKTQEFSLNEAFDFGRLKGMTSSDDIQSDIPEQREENRDMETETGYTEVKEQGVSDTVVSDGELPDGEIPDGEIPDGEIPNGELPETDISETPMQETDGTDDTEHTVSGEESSEEEVPEEESYSGNYTENNLAQHSSDVRKRNRYMPSRYDELLGEEYDGQITISSSIDGDMVEKQITGQMDIEEFLRNWEEKKLRKKYRDNELSRTDDLYDKLKGVIPSNSGGSVKTLEESRPIIKMVNVPETMLINNDETENESEAGELPETGDLTESEDEEGSGTEGMEGTAAEDLPEIDEDLPESDEDLPESEEDLPESEEDLSESEEDLPESDMDLPYSDEGSGEEPGADTEDETDGYPDNELPGSEYSENGAPDKEDAPKETEIDLEGYYGDEESEPEENKKPEKLYDTSEIRAAFNYDYVEDIGEVEELEDIEQPDEVDDIISTSNLPLEQIEAEFDAMSEERYLSDNPMVHSSRFDENGRMKHPSYMVLEETVKSKRDFDEEEMKLFGRYDGIEHVKAQLVDALDDMSMAAARGNVVVMGAEGTGRRGLAIDMVKAMQVMDSSFLGKVAKISGEALNKKNIPSTLRKLNNGALIVENAGGLTVESMEMIGEALITSQDSVLVVLEGTKETIQPILDSNKPLLEVVFDARIDVSDFSDDDLVAYAKGYAKEQEYSIDEETGVLALYTKIAEMQTLDHRVTIDDVKDLIDKAIVHVNKKTLAHLLDVLFSRRYDDNDCIIIREKDFVEK